MPAHIDFERKSVSQNNFRGFDKRFESGMDDDVVTKQ